MTLGSLFAQAASILALSILARLVAPSEVGTYQQLALIYGVISPLLLGGLPAGLLYFVPRARTDAGRREWITSAYLLLAALGAISTAAVFFLRDPLANLMDNPHLAPALAYYSPYLLFAFLASPTPNALIAARRPKAAGAVNAAGGGLALIAVTLAATLDPSAKALAVGLSVSAGLWAALSVVMVARTVGLSAPGPAQRSHWRRLLVYGGPLALTGLAGRIGYQFDRIVVSANFSAADFAVYALGTVEVPIALLLQQAVTSVLIPELTSLWMAGRIDELVVLWRESIRKTSLVLLPLFAFLMVSASDAVRVLYGSHYDRSAELFRIYLLMLPIRVATFGVIPQAIGRTGINMVAAFIVLFTNVVVALALVHPLGLVGPALAAPLSSVLAAAYYLDRLKSIIGVSVTQQLPLRQMAHILAVAALSAAAVWPISHIPVAAGPRLLIEAVVFSLCCVTGLRLSGELNDDDWLRLRALVRRYRPGARVGDAA